MRCHYWRCSCSGHCSGESVRRGLLRLYLDRSRVPGPKQLPGGGHRAVRLPGGVLRGDQRRRPVSRLPTAACDRQQQGFIGTSYPACVEAGVRGTRAEGEVQRTRGGEVERQQQQQQAAGAASNSKWQQLEEMRGRGGRAASGTCIYERYAIGKGSRGRRARWGRRSAALGSCGDAAVETGGKDWRLRSGR